MIQELLNEGKENAINLKDLVRYFNTSSQREVLAQIERERKAGTPILAQKSNGGGYYLARDKEELKEYLNLLGRNIKTQQEIYQALKATESSM